MLLRRAKQVQITIKIGEAGRVEEGPRVAVPANIEAVGVLPLVSEVRGSHPGGQSNFIPTMYDPRRPAQEVPEAPHQHANLSFLKDFGNTPRGDGWDQQQQPIMFNTNAQPPLQQPMQPILFNTNAQPPLLQPMQPTIPQGRRSAQQSSQAGDGSNNDGSSRTSTNEQPTFGRRAKTVPADDHNCTKLERAQTHQDAVRQQMLEAREKKELQIAKRKEEERIFDDRVRRDQQGLAAKEKSEQAKERQERDDKDAAAMGKKGPKRGGIDDALKADLQRQIDEKKMLKENEKKKDRDEERKLDEKMKKWANPEQLKMMQPAEQPAATDSSVKSPLIESGVHSPVGGSKSISALNDIPVSVRNNVPQPPSVALTHAPPTYRNFQMLERSSVAGPNGPPVAEEYSYLPQYQYTIGAQMYPPPAMMSLVPQYPLASHPMLFNQSYQYSPGRTQQNQGMTQTQILLDHFVRETGPNRDNVASAQTLIPQSILQRQPFFSAQSPPQGTSNGSFQLGVHNTNRSSLQCDAKFIGTSVELECEPPVFLKVQRR